MITRLLRDLALAWWPPLLNKYRPMLEPWPGTPGRFTVTRHQPVLVPVRTTTRPPVPGRRSGPRR